MSVTGNERYSIDSKCRANIQRCIQYWLAMEDKTRLFNSKKHISLEEAYERILEKLSTMDERFYDHLHEQNLQTSSINEDKFVFAQTELMKTLEIIYSSVNYRAIDDDDAFDPDDDSKESTKASAGFQKHCKSYEKLRKRCATLIWKLWNDERSESPRCGLINISMMENSTPKILLVGYKYDGKYCYSYPKGKPNIGEMLIGTMFREFAEETNKDLFHFYMDMDESDLEIIKKNPYLGRRSNCHSGKHYYALLKTSVEYTDYRPQKYEILDVEWHSVIRIPCCPKCRIQTRYKSVGGSEEQLPINYHMITLRDVNNKNPIIIDLLRYIQAHGDPNIFKSYLHAHRRCEHDLA